MRQAFNGCASRSGMIRECTRMYFYTGGWARTRSRHNRSRSALEPDNGLTAIVTRSGPTRTRYRMRPVSRPDEDHLTGMPESWVGTEIRSGVWE